MRELVSATFKAAWETAQPGVPLILENEAAPSGDEQVLLTIQPTMSQQATQGRAGTRKTRRNGWIQVKLWSPANAGTATATARGDAVRRILEMVSLPSPIPGDDPVTTMAESAGPRGHSSGDGSRWYMSLIRIPYWYFETK